MKPIFLIVAFGVAVTPSAMAQEVEAPASAKEAQAAESAQVALQSATDQINQALLRGDAGGVLKWLAPDFELGRRQYRVRDLTWMKKALPLQFKRGRYTLATAEVRQVELKEGVASANVKFDVEWTFNPGIDGGSQIPGVEGSSTQEWVKMAQGWRLRRNDAMFEGLPVLAAPEAPLRRQEPIAADSSAATIGIPVEEPRLVLERQSAFFDRFGVSLVFSPDGKQLAFNYDPQTLRLLSLSDGKVLRELPDKYSIDALAYTHDGSLWTKDSERRVRQWNTDARSVQREWLASSKNDTNSYRTSVAQDGRSFATLRGREVEVRSSTQDQPKVTFTSDAKEVRGIDCSPDGRYLALTTSDGIEIREAKDGALLHIIKGEEWGRFLSDGKSLVTMKLPSRNSDPFAETEGKEKDTLFLRLVTTGEKEREIAIPLVWSRKQQELRERLDAGKSVSFEGFGYPGYPVPAVSPDGRFAATVYYDGSVGVWDTRTGRFIQTLRGFSRLHSDGLPKLVFSPDGKQLAEISGEGEIGVWNVRIDGAK